MFGKNLFAAMLLAGLPSAACAAEAPLQEASKTFATTTSTIGDLLDNPAAKAVIDKHLPGFSTNPQLEMARSMTLKQIQGFAPDSFTDEVLAKIDIDLAALKAK